MSDEQKDPAVISADELHPALRSVKDGPLPKEDAGQDIEAVTAALEEES